jgi:hypothetical protein
MIIGIIIGIVTFLGALMGLACIQVGREQSHKIMIIIGLSITLLSASAAFYYFVGRHEQKIKPFKDRLPEYTAITRTQVGDPYLKGKIIAIDKNRNIIDKLYYDLSEELRANTPEEVGTIVWLQCDENVVGYYGSTQTEGSEATYWTCDVTIIDKSIPAILEKRNFAGAPPPSKSAGSGTGGKPTKEIIDYLVSLPRK